MKIILRIILSLIIIIIVSFLLFRSLNFQFFSFPENALSMHPTISPGDICICKMEKVENASELESGMIVLFRYNYDWLILTKRLIAKEHQWIQMKNNLIFVDGVLLEEQYIDYHAGEFLNFGEIDSLMIEEGKLFVMGDNRGNSLDSRNAQFGFVDIQDVVGKPLMIIWSKDRSRIGKKLADNEI